MLKKSIAAAAALSMLAMPVLAQSSAPSTAVAAPEPAGESVEGSELRRGYILPLLGIAAAVLAILALTDTWPFDEDDEAFPVSP